MFKSKKEEPISCKDIKLTLQRPRVRGVDRLTRLRLTMNSDRGRAIAPNGYPNCDLTHARALFSGPNTRTYYEVRLDICGMRSKRVLNTKTGVPVRAIDSLQIRVWSTRFVVKQVFQIYVMIFVRTPGATIGSNEGWTHEAFVNFVPNRL